MLRCHCGGSFGVIEQGATYHAKSGIYSADRLRCDCGIEIFSLAQEPTIHYPSAEWVAEAADRLRDRGRVIYGKGE